MRFIFRALIVAALAYYHEACTVIAAGKRATIDGSVLLAHTDDAGGGAADVRLVRVPAQDHAHGSQRAVYNFRNGYPRLLSLDRGSGYQPKNEKEALMRPMGYIPQVSHTFAYFDQDYAMMNEKQLSIAESTCGARTVGWPLDAGEHGKNLFGIAELTKVALERCDTARCAVQVMGDLAVTFGFFSEDSGKPEKPDYGDSAECLVIGDKRGEIWVFHILTGLRNTSAVWAAQRVRPDHVTAIANEFIIRTMDLSDEDYYMASSNVHQVAQELGWWSESSGKAFDFTAAYGFADKDAIGPLYTGRRIWRIFDVFAPSLKLDARLGSFSQYVTYPFSVKPDELIELMSVMELLKDHYEGTPYDMTKGIASGPFNSPVRYDGKSQGVVGGWERPISMHRTIFSFVAQIQNAFSDDLGGVLWYGQGAPHGSVYVPFSCMQDSVPDSYLKGSQSVFDMQSAWRAFDFVNNWSLLRYNVMIEDIKGKAHQLQERAFALRHRMEKSSNSLTVKTLEAESNAFAQQVVDTWWKYAFHLVAKYSDGYIITGEEADDMKRPGYPSWWLQISEFSKWPGDSFKPRLGLKQVVPHAALQTALIPTAESHELPIASNVISVLGYMISGCMLGAIAVLVIQRRRRKGYHSVL